MSSEAIAFVVHRRNRKAWEYADRMRTAFEAADLRVFLPQRGESSDSCRMVITFGGDGTLLAGAASAISYRCPLLGINLGTMGFLTESDPEQSERIVNAVLSRTYTIEQRDLLQVRCGDEAENYLALNDAVVTRGGFARLIQVETRINQEHWGTFIADGMIAATPTGSTGYSLSAGGPVIAPGVSCMAVTPVCPHSMQHCPCIVPRNAEITFILSAEREQQAQLQIDGRNVRTLKAGDQVHITGAAEAVSLVRIGEYRFFKVLQTKLTEWSCSGEEKRQ